MQQTNTTQPLKTKGSPEFLPAIIFFKLCKQLYLNMLITVPQERWESACLWVKSGKAQIRGVLTGYTVTKFNNTKKMLSEDGLQWETFYQHFFFDSLPHMQLACEFLTIMPG